MKRWWMPSWPPDGVDKSIQVTTMQNKNAKEALKALRKERKAFIDRARKTVKEQNKKISAIKSQLKKQPQTVPEIASALRMRTSEVLITVMALRKYGEILEDAKDGDYFKYRLA
jgi:DNA-directed RNA polymerase specialized sigma subunit